MNIASIVQKPCWYFQDTFKQMDRLRDTVHKQEEEIDHLRTERQEQVAREREMMASQDKHERGVVAQLNDECRKIAEIIGSNPSRVNIPG